MNELSGALIAEALSGLPVGVEERPILGTCRELTIPLPTT